MPSRKSKRPKQVTVLDVHGDPRAVELLEEQAHRLTDWCTKAMRQLTLKQRRLLALSAGRMIAEIACTHYEELGETDAEALNTLHIGFALMGLSIVGMLEAKQEIH